MTDISDLQETGSTQEAEIRLGLPIISCPCCGEHLRLSTIMPEEDNRQRMTFVCECGFDYLQSSSVAVERSL